MRDLRSDLGRASRRSLALATALLAASGAIAAAPAAPRWEIPVVDAGIAAADAWVGARTLAAGHEPGIAPLLPTVPASSSFMTAYLAPRMAARLSGFDHVVGSPIFRAEPAASAWRGDVSRSVERQALSAARSATRRFLVERWDPEIALRRDADGLRFGRARAARTEGVRIGFAGLRPRVTWQALAGDGSLKLSLDGRGRLGASWTRRADRVGSLGATVDPAARRVEAGWRGAF